MSNSLTCAYVTDRGFLACTCFSIATLVDNASIPLDIFLVHTGINESDLEAARGYLARIGADVTFVAIPEGELDGLPRPQSLPHSSYGRLLLHKLLPAHTTRVLYLDGDTLVEIDIAPLADMDLEGATVGAVLDVGRVMIGRRKEAQERLELGADGDYFNSGVLLIDWEKWQAERVGERSLAALIETPDRFTQGDQCALNFVCRGAWRPLDLTWNFQPACVIHDDREAALFHFLGGRKPWRSDHIRHPMRFVRRYEELYKGSPWEDDFRAPLLPDALSDGLRVAKRAMSPRYWRNRKAFGKIAS